MRITLSILKADIGSIGGHVMPCKLNATVSYFDGPPVVTEVADVFDHPYWDDVRIQITAGMIPGKRMTPRLKPLGRRIV